jgi:hypothetical protein
MAVNYVQPIGNFYSRSVFCQYGKVTSYTCSREEAYVEAFIHTDIDYTVTEPPATSSIFLAKVNFADTASYHYTANVTLSGSVTELQSGSFADYYIQVWWGAAGDLHYTWANRHTCSIDVNGQWQESAQTANPGYKFALLRSRSDHKIWSLATVYPSSGSIPATKIITGSYISPGVDGYFCAAASPYALYGLYTDYSWFCGTTQIAKLAKLRLVSNGAILATTNDTPPVPPEPPAPVVTYTIMKTAGFFFP